MNRNNSRNPSSNSQKKYIKLNLKGGSDNEEPSQYNEDTMVVDHPYKEEAYDLNQDECDQTGGKLTIPYDPFAPHNPLKSPFNYSLPVGFPQIIPNKIDKLYPINGPRGGVGFSTVSPTPYRLNQHSFPNNNIQNIKIPLIPSNYMLPGMNGLPGLGMNGLPANSLGMNGLPGLGMNGLPVRSLGMNGLPVRSLGMNGLHGLGMNGLPGLGMNGLPVRSLGMNGLPVRSLGMNGLPVRSLGMNGLNRTRFGSYRLKDYLYKVITSLEMLLSRKKYANRFEKAHINDQLDSLSRQLSRAIEIYKPTKSNNISKNLVNLLEKVKKML
jgi:hypothetical protein